MPYVIGFSQTNKSKVSETTLPNAQAAYREASALQFSDEKIRYIKVPGGGEIGMGELKMRAEEEETRPRTLKTRQYN